MQLGEGWNALETERQEIAGARRTESLLTAVVHGGGAVLAALLALGLAWLTLFGLSRQDDSADIAAQILIEDLVADQPRLYGPPITEPQRLLPPVAPETSDDGNSTDGP
jgi:hypothetical protein